MLFYYAYWELSLPCVLWLCPDLKTARKHYQELQPALWRNTYGVPHIDKKIHRLSDTSDLCRALWKDKRSTHNRIEWCVIFFFFWEFVCIDCDMFVLLFPLPVFSISSISLPVFSLTLTVFLCCYLSTAHQAPPAGYAAEPLPHRTKQPGIHWYAVQQSHELSLWRFVFFSASEVIISWMLVLSVAFVIWLYLIT